MGNCYYCSLIVLQMVLKPCHTLGIKMVGRLVKKQDVRFFKKESAKCNPASFPAGEQLYRCISRRTSQCIHCHLKP